MRYFIFSLFLLLFSAQHVPDVHAQDNSLKHDNLTELGNGLFVETIPATYILVADDYAPPASEQVVVIPATYETITETVILQEAYSSLKVSPPVYKSDGSVDITAKATVVEVPAITKEVKRRVQKTPPKVVKRLIPSMHTPRAFRKLTKNEIYIIKDSQGTELQRYDDPSKLVDYINSR